MTLAQARLDAIKTRKTAPSGGPSALRKSLRTLSFRLLDEINAPLERLGLRAMRLRDLYPWQKREIAAAGDYVRGSIPSEALGVLRPDNERLLELRKRYAAFDSRATTPSGWTDSTLTADDIMFFRGDNPYIWQLRGIRSNELNYALSYYSLKASKASDLLDRLSEDGLFGAHTFEIDNRLVSRDLLDSVGEIDFIRSHMDLDARPIKILDIGAGYGRLPYRLSEVTGPNVEIFATDAYAASTFLCEFYLGFRRAARAQTTPLDEVESLLEKQTIDLATNIHSFSECAVDAIAWWTERLARSGVRFLMVIPNYVDEESGRCLTDRGEDMESVFEKFGYRIKVRRPRYADEATQKYGVDACLIHLFELHA
jgi:SAM-dependent methyltransferase